MGQTSRWQRFTAELLYVMASGKRIDENKTERFGEILKEVYSDPFKKKTRQPETAQEIISYISGRVKELISGSA